MSRTPEQTDNTPRVMGNIPFDILRGLGPRKERVTKSNQVNPEVYYSRHLDQVDSQHVQQFADIVKGIAEAIKPSEKVPLEEVVLVDDLTTYDPEQPSTIDVFVHDDPPPPVITIPKIRTGLEAIGNTAINPKSRKFEPRDVDLLLLYQYDPDPRDNIAVQREKRGIVIGKITEHIEQSYQGSDAILEYSPTTTERKRVRGNVGNGVELVDYEEINNNPSFTIQHPNGLPLHIKIAGIDSQMLDDHLQLESDANGHYSLLHYDPAPEEVSPE